MIFRKYIKGVLKMAFEEKYLEVLHHLVLHDEEKFEDMSPDAMTDIYSACLPLCFGVAKDSSEAGYKDYDHLLNKKWEVLDNLTVQQYIILHGGLPIERLLPRSAILPKLDYENYGDMIRLLKHTYNVCETTSDVIRDIYGDNVVVGGKKYSYER